MEDPSQAMSLIFVSALFVLIPGIPTCGQEVEPISCSFASEFLDVGIHDLCCNYSSESVFSPRVHIGGELSSFMRSTSRGCDTVYHVRIEPQYDGLEISVSYGSSASGRWSDTINLSPQNTTGSPQPSGTARSDPGIPTSAPGPSNGPTPDGANLHFLWFLIILIVLIAICICTMIGCPIYWHRKRRTDRGQRRDDPIVLQPSIQGPELGAAEQTASQNGTAPGPVQEGDVEEHEEFYDAEQELRVDGVLQGHNASQESDSGRLFPQDLCFSRDKNDLSSFLSLFRDSSECTLKEGKGAQAISQGTGVKQTEEFFDCEEVHTLGIGVIEDDVSENVCQGDTCFESEMEVSHAVECSELVTTTAAKQIFYSQKVVLVVSEIRLPDYGKQAELVVMPATPFMDANTTKVIPVFEDVIPEYTSAATPPPSVMVSPASKTIAGEVGHPIGRDSASSLDASAQTETNLLPYKPGGKGPSGPPSLDVTAKESRHMERPNIDDDSDSDSGDDDEPGGAGCTGGEVPTAGEPVLLGVNDTNVKLGLTGENSNVRPSNSNGSGCLLWKGTNMIREDADGDVSPSAHTEPVEEPICRDFNGNWVFRPEKMCVRNSNRAIMELRSGSGGCPTGQLGANTGTSDSRWDINSVRINKLNEPFGLRQRHGVRVPAADPG